ncbi:hypothetical protein C8R47DRAFT_1082281 [Mycena vitilis]|nr:hypothetical protein C8R47DRAFT_1082281 [Mycena vitilis]
MVFDAYDLDFGNTEAEASGKDVGAGVNADDEGEGDDVGSEDSDKESEASEGEDAYGDKDEDNSMGLNTCTSAWLNFNCFMINVQPQLFGLPRTGCFPVFFHINETDTDLHSMSTTRGPFHIRVDSGKSEWQYTQLALELFTSSFVQRKKEKDDSSNPFLDSGMACTL